MEILQQVSYHKHVYCGMRHNNSGLSEDDLSRLTGSSSNTSSSLSSSSKNENGSSKGDFKKFTDGKQQTDLSSASSASTIIDKNLKNSQKNQFNSNYLPEIIDPLEWQKSSRKRKERQDSNCSQSQDRKLVRSNSEEILQPIDANDVIRRVSSTEDFKRPLHEIKENNTENNHDHHSKQHIPRLETSPARSHRHSPSRRYKDSDELESENEKRRSSERFCKVRAQAGRKGVVKRFVPKYRNDDMGFLKNDRRGFVSQFKVEERGTRKEEAADGEKQQLHDYNDNNLIDFHHTAESSKLNCSAEAALPWESSNRLRDEEEQPVLSHRFDHMEDEENIAPIPITTDNEPVKSFRVFHKNDTREMMVKRDSRDTYDTPDDRLKNINKKLVALKKRLAVCEEQFERKSGYKPSQLDKYNDKQIKSIMTEINKLRKEKQEIKSESLALIGLKHRKISGEDTKYTEGMQRVDKIKGTLNEIDKKLIDKRGELSRPENLEHLSAEQLVQEKTSVQHALLYFESLYGRPSTKEERDLARNIYERYRVLKRMVTRSIQSSALTTSFGGSELQTIMENEQLTFTNENTIITPLKTSPESSPNENRTQAVVLPYEEEDEDTTTTTTTEETGVGKTIPQKSTSINFSEKLHNLSIDELWRYLDQVRDEKRDVKRTIREYETLFEEQNGRKMLKPDRIYIEDTYSNYKELKAKVRLLQALVRKHISH